METRQLGKSDLELSVIGLGTWAIGGDVAVGGWGPQDERDSIATILRALELGVNWIDTAAIYGQGESERVIAKALSEWQEPVIIATKCGLLANGERPPEKCLRAESIREEIEASLKRLQLEVIDLYQIHWPLSATSLEGIEEAFETLLSLKSEGKIRWLGVSNFSVPQLECVAKRGELSSLQPPYNLLNRKIENDILPWCKENDVGVIAYSPLASGLLTGKLSKEWVTSLPKRDWRKAHLGKVHEKNYLQEPALSDLVAKLEGIQEAIPNRPLSQIAINWVLAQPGVTSAIVGARRREQIELNVEAAQWALSDQQVRYLDELS